MDIRQIETFVEVVNCKSFSKAADNLFLTQPTISSHISALEKEFSSQLIRRTTKDFEVTEAGLKLYSYGVRILSIRDKINESLMGGRNILLKIGSSSAVGFCDLPKLVSLFNKEFPDIKFSVTNSDSMDIIKKVNEGILEVGLVGTKVDDFDLQYVPFTKDKLVFVMPKNEKYLAISKSKSFLNDLLKEPFIMREDDSGTKIEILKYLSKNKMKPENLNIVASMSDPFSIIECIKHGLGISILSTKILDVSKNDDIIVKELDSEHSRQFYLVSPKEKYMSNLAKEFVNFVLSVTSEKSL